MNVFRGECTDLGDSILFVTGYQGGEFQIVVDNSELRLDKDDAERLIRHLQEFIDVG